MSEVGFEVVKYKTNSQIRKSLLLKGNCDRYQTDNNVHEFEVIMRITAITHTKIKKYIK